MSASTAKSVLRGRSLRWSSPVLFNDPFDVPRELALGLSPSEIQKAAGHHFAHLLQNPPSNLDELNPKVAFIVEAAKRVSPALMKELVEAALDESAKQAVNKDSTTLNELRAMWRSWIPDFRILCLCASHEKTSMWYHYAGEYKGVVIELECSDERDSPWLLAEPVQYPKEPPEIFRAAGWGRHMTLRTELSIQKLLHAYTFYKTPDWSYEEEWRVTSFKRPQDTGNFTDWTIPPRDFAKVYLGPHISDLDRLELLSLLTDDLSHVIPLQARIELDRRFTFVPMTV